MIKLALRNFEVALGYEPGSATLEDIGKSNFGVAVWATSQSANPQTTPLGRIPAGPDWRTDLKGSLRCVVGPDYRWRALCESADGGKVFKWGAEQGSLRGEPSQEHFPLKLRRIDPAEEPGQGPGPGPRQSRRDDHGQPSPRPAGGPGRKSAIAEMRTRKDGMPGQSMMTTGRLNNLTSGT